MRHRSGPGIANGNCKNCGAKGRHWRNANAQNEQKTRDRPPGLTPFVNPKSGKDNQFNAPFSASPTRKRAVFEAARGTVAPVRGLRAMPAARLTGMKLPKPTKRTSSPFLSESVTAQR